MPLSLAAQRRPEYENVFAAGLENPQKAQETIEIEDVSPMLKELTNDETKV